MHAKCKLLGCYTYVGLTRFKVNELQKYGVTKTSILFFLTLLHVFVSVPCLEMFVVKVVNSHQRYQVIVLYAK